MKKIFLFFAAILCAMSVSAKVIYLKAGKWTDGGAKFGCHTWGSSDKSGFMTHVEGDIYKFETPDANTDVIFTRVAGNASGIWDKEWDRVQTKFENGKDMFTITDWKAGKWEVYTPLATYTFAKNSTIYLDFRAVTVKGADIPKADKAETVYDGNAGGNVIAVTFTADVKWAEGLKFLKTAQSGWSNDIPFKLPEEGQNCAQVAADGKSYTWTTYSENCQVTVSAENGTVNGAGTFKIGTSVTLTAVPNDGYEFVNWTVGGKEVSTANPYTFTVNDNITLVANFKEAAAKTYTITTSATNGTVEGAATVVEGESVTLTATANPGYKFVNWTIGGVEVSTDNPYIFVPTEDATVVANFEQLPPETVYFVNVADWTGTIKIHAWDGTAPGTEWPGNPAHKEDYQIGGHDVYSLTAAVGAYAKVIFNGNGGQTADLTWSEGVDKYYIHGYNGNTGWYTKAEAEAILVVPVEYEYVYLINTNDWAKAHIYTWTPEVAGWPGAAMTKEAEQIAGKDVYSYKVVKGTTFGGMNFNCGGDECKTGDLTWHAGKYYAPSKDKWYDTKEAAAEALAAPAKCYLMGIGDDWTEGIEMEEDGDQFKLLCQPIAEGEQFKFKYGDTWTTDVENFTENGVQWVETSPGSGQYNITLPAGNYDFYYKKNDNKVFIAAATDCGTDPDVPTALDNLTTTIAPVKAIVNGQLVIIKNGVQYNAQGQVVK